MKYRLNIGKKCIIMILVYNILSNFKYSDCHVVVAKNDITKGLTYT